MIHETLLDYHVGNIYTVFQRDRGFINNITIADLDNMYPYERDIYLMKMNQLIEEKIKDDSKL